MRGGCGWYLVVVDRNFFILFGFSVVWICKKELTMWFLAWLFSIRVFVVVRLLFICGDGTIRWLFRILMVLLLSEVRLVRGERKGLGFYFFLCWVRGYGERFFFFGGLYWGCGLGFIRFYVWSMRVMWCCFGMIFFFVVLG